MVNVVLEKFSFVLKVSKKSATHFESKWLQAFLSPQWANQRLRVKL